MKKEYSVLLISLIFLLIISHTAVSISESENYTFLVYYYGKHEKIKDLEDFLIQEFGSEPICLTNLTDTKSWQPILSLISILQSSNVSLLPPFCIVCIEREIEKGGTNLYFENLFPLVLIFKKGELKAIVFGIKTISDWRKILTYISDNLSYIFTPTATIKMNSDLKGKIETIFSSQKQTINKNVLYLTLSLAFADSINPCTFSVYSTLLLISLYLLGKVRAALTGIFFIIAVYICYYLLGLGLVKALTILPYTDKIVTLLGLIVGFLSILRNEK